MTVTFNIFSTTQVSTSFWATYMPPVANSGVTGGISTSAPNLFGVDSDYNLLYYTSAAGSGTTSCITKVSNTGSVIWSNYQNTVGQSLLTSISPNGNYVVASGVTGIYGTGAGRSASYGISLINAISGSVVFNLSANNSVVGNSRTDANLYKTTVDNYGNMYVLNSTGLFAYTSSGTLKWSTQFTYNTLGGINTTAIGGFNVVSDRGGNVYVVVLASNGNGTFPQLSVANSPPIFLFKFSSTGTLISSKIINQYSGGGSLEGVTSWYGNGLTVQYDSTANIIFIQANIFNNSGASPTYFDILFKIDTFLNRLNTVQIPTTNVGSIYSGFWPDGSGGGYLVYYNTTYKNSGNQGVGGYNIVKLNSNLVVTKVYPTAFISPNDWFGTCCDFGVYSDFTLLPGPGPTNAFYFNYYADRYNNATITSLVNIGPNIIENPANAIYNFTYANGSVLTTNGSSGQAQTVALFVNSVSAPTVTTVNCTSPVVNATNIVVTLSSVGVANAITSNSSFTTSAATQQIFYLNTGTR